jgi:hypothetical protein
MHGRRQIVVSNPTLESSILLALLPNAPPLVSRFFGEMSKKRRFKATVVMLTLKKNLRTFPATVINKDHRMSGKMSFS